MTSISTSYGSRAITIPRCDLRVAHQQITATYANTIPCYHTHTDLVDNPYAEEDAKLELDDCVVVVVVKVLL